MAFSSLCRFSVTGNSVMLNIRSRTNRPLALANTRAGGFVKWEYGVTSGFRKSCTATSRPSLLEHASATWILEEETQSDDSVDKITELVDSVRSMLTSMEDGEISMSPYDTAWVAMVEDKSQGRRVPQFPSSLDWIANNQLSDGSWGDKEIFSVYDRLINTLACFIALTTWKVHPDKIDKGVSFVRDNISKLENQKAAQMPIGFEVALPSLIDVAKDLGIEIPNDSSGVQEIHRRRNLKLTRIPKDTLYSVPTTLLYTLEGLPGLDWQKLRKLQWPNGSFCFSPASTAFALQQTKDENCFRFLEQIVKKFNGGAPNVYPVDIFEHLWAVDRLQRLGVSRYFQLEIEECMAYVHRYWTDDEGICWGRNSRFTNMDDTSMGFRLLRLNGYDVSADVYRHFEKDGEFFSFAGQSTEAVTGMYNLYRASQMQFPGEVVLENARQFSAKHLQDGRVKNELVDKWIISKDLPGEVGYALDVPWYASLPRVEARFYLEQYGGADDVWIGKTLYRMPYVNNNTYLDLAKLDYKNCQILHQQEWKSIQKNYSVGEFRLSEDKLLLLYFMAAASVFEPERSGERLAWTKTAIFMEMVSLFSERQLLTRVQKQAFVNEFEHGSKKSSNFGKPNVMYESGSTLVRTLLRILNELSLDILMAHGREIHHQLHKAWLKWLRTWEMGGEIGQADGELLVSTLNLCADYGVGSELVTYDISSMHPKYQQLMEVTNKVCHQLRAFQLEKEQKTNMNLIDVGRITFVHIESDMQELVKLVLVKSSNDLPIHVKQNFLAVVRSYYYAAYCNTGTINSHIAKVLFERV